MSEQPRDIGAAAGGAAERPSRLPLVAATGFLLSPLVALAVWIGRGEDYPFIIFIVVSAGVGVLFTVAALVIHFAWPAPSRATFKIKWLCAVVGLFAGGVAFSLVMIVLLMWYLLAGVRPG